MMRPSTMTMSSLASANPPLKPMIKNRNPMNLEKMRIGFKPCGFPTEKRRRSYWNSLDLYISGKHTKAVVTHWTGRKVCSASTQEWAIKKFLYNYTDSAALKCVGTIIGQRCLETGISEVHLQIQPEDLKKERMRNFVDAIEATGLILQEPDQYFPFNPHANILSPDETGKVPVRPWEVKD